MTLRPLGEVAPGEAAQGGLPAVLREYMVWTLALAGVSAVCLVLRHHRFERPGGWRVNGGDLMEFRERFALFRTAGFWTKEMPPFPYPAPVAVALGWIFRLADPLADYVAMCGVALACWAGWLVATLRRRGVPWGWGTVFAAAVLVTCWPVYFLLYTANTEGLVMVFLGAGMLTAMRGRPAAGAAMMGVAGALKVYPLLLLGLLPARKRYTAFALGLAVAAATTLGSLAILGPTVSEAGRQIREGMGTLRAASLMPDTPLIVNHSLFGPVKKAAIAIERSRYPVPVTGEDFDRRGVREWGLMNAIWWWYVGTIAVAGAAVYAGRIRKLPVLNQLLALAVAAVLVTPGSVDYTLVELLVPFGLLCGYAAGEGRTAGAVRACLGCFLFLFGAGDFFMWRGWDFSCQMRTVALVVLLVLVLRFPFEDSVERDCGRFAG